MTPLTLHGNVLPHVASSVDRREPQMRVRSVRAICNTGGTRGKTALCSVFGHPERVSACETTAERGHGAAPSPRRPLRQRSGAGGGLCIAPSARRRGGDDPRDELACCLPPPVRPRSVALYVGCSSLAVRPASSPLAIGARKAVPARHVRVAPLNLASTSRPDRGFSRDLPIRHAAADGPPQNSGARSPRAPLPLHNDSHCPVLGSRDHCIKRRLGPCSTSEAKARADPAWSASCDMFADLLHACSVTCVGL